MISECIIWTCAPGVSHYIEVLVLNTSIWRMKFAIQLCKSRVLSLPKRREKVKFFWWVILFQINCGIQLVSPFSKKNLFIPYKGRGPRKQESLGHLSY